MKHSFIHSSCVIPGILPEQAMSPDFAKSLADCLGMEAFWYERDEHWHAWDDDNDSVVMIDLTLAWAGILKLLDR